MSVTDKVQYSFRYTHGTCPLLSVRYPSIIVRLHDQGASTTYCQKGYNGEITKNEGRKKEREKGRKEG